MIIPLPFIVSLLFTITYATDFKYEIDLNRCGQDADDMVCFIRKSCFETEANNDASKTIMGRFIVDPAVGAAAGVENCDVIVQTKKLNEKKLMLLMQVKGSLKSENGIKIFQEANPNAPDPTPAPLIDCSKEKNPEGKLTSLTLKPLGLSSFESNIMFCALTLNHETKYEDAFTDIEAKPYITFTTTSTDETLSWEKNKILWKAPQASCDSDFVGNAESSEYILTEIDRTRFLFKCPGDGKLLLTYKKDNKDVTIETNEVKCEDQKYKWTSPEEVTLDKDTPFSIGCKGPKYCTTCTEPTAFSRDECPTCEALPDSPNDENECKVRKCPDDMFTIDGQEEVKSTKGITCEKKSDGTGSEWLIHNTDGGNVVDGKVSCYKFKGCRPLTKLNCPEGVECKTGPVFNQEIFNYTCPDADAVLHQNKEPVTPSCDKDTHEWKGIDNTVDLYCAVDQTKTDASKGDGETKTGGSGLTIGLAVVGSLVAVAAIVGGAYYMLVIRKRQEAKKTTKKEEGTSKKSSKKVESKSGAAGSSNEAKKEEKKSDPNKESEKPAAEAAKEAPKDGKEAPKEGAEAPKEPPKDAAATPAAAATPGAPPTPAAPATPAADSAPAPADATPV